MTKFGNILFIGLVLVFVSFAVPLSAEAYSSENSPNIDAENIVSTFSEQSTHFIIAFDLKVKKYREQLHSRETLARIDVLLNVNNYNSERDYISVIGWSLDIENPSIEDYARPCVVNNTPILWYKLDGGSLYSLFGNWPSNLPYINSNTYYSMQSFSKPYSVIATMQEGVTVCADRTILILVTDGVVNGADDDYYKEWGRAWEDVNANRIKLNQIRNSVFDTMRQFNKEFYFDELESQRTIIKDEYKIISYEVIASNKPSIYSITDLPSPLPFRRIRGGYKLQVDAKSLDDRYEIQEVVIEKKSSGKILYSSGNGNLNHTFKTEDISNGDSLMVSTSILFKDGLYNGTLLSPRNFNYRDGMSIPQVIHLNDEAKVLGLIPLTDGLWWWCHNNVVTAVLVWDVILLLVFIIVIVAIFYWIYIGITNYKPDNKNLKITKV